MEMRLPDIGDFSDVPVIEVHVAPGDQLTVDDPVVTLESDKATMDVPASEAGVVSEVRVSVGDTVSEGDVLLTFEPAGAEAAAGGGDQEAAEAEAMAAGPDQAGYGSPSGVYASPGQGPTQAGATTPDGAPRPAPASGRPSDLEAEVLVLGAGPGGYSAAFRAADLGKKVVVVDPREALGGVCLNIGCIPSKALLHAAKVIAETREMAEHGLRFAAPEVDLDALRSWKEGVVKRLTGGLGGLARQRKVTTVRGTGRFVSPNQLEVAAADDEQAPGDVAELQRAR